MPSRFATALIVLFWLSVIGYQGYARVLPWLLASDVPSVAVSATDEASRAKVRWTILFNKKPAGSLVTELRPDSGDGYTFAAEYKKLELTILVFDIRVPTATTEVMVDRAGNLRRQTLSGKGELSGLGHTFTGSASVVSHVVGGELRGRAEGTIETFRLPPTDLPPVPVPAGQVLNPMLPVNRLAGVLPGKTWRIQLVDPLGDSLKRLGMEGLKKLGVDSRLLAGRDENEELLAVVQAAAENVPGRRGEPEIACRVIEYRGKDDKAIARTWVSVADGRVMRQEATVDGNSIRLDRDE